jgi:hypothetical protein
MDGPALGQVVNSMQGLHLEIGTHIETILHRPVFQALPSETSHTHASRAEAIHDTSNRFMGLPSVPPSPSSQSSGESDYLESIGCPNFLFPPLPFSEQKSIPASPSSLGKRKLPEYQSSLSDKPTDCENTDPTAYCTRNVKRIKSENELPIQSRKKASEELLAQLLDWGFVQTEGNSVRCPCGEEFNRRPDAQRHWICWNNLENLSGSSTRYQKHQCEVCGEVLSRRDSLIRHRPHCGERRKRKRLYDNDRNSDGARCK